MLSRYSKVDHLKIIVVTISSIAQIGDSKIVNGFSRALAVQREAEVFFGNEGDFSNYWVFKEPIPLPPIDEVIMFQSNNLSPCIKVSNINITGVSAASIVHIGSSDHVYMESRIKHIRQLFEHE
ncbi:spore germination protein GerPE [Bacillus sp. CGMCC 1.16607]|uniref:spore germination protein GerPE n=1 Tax=Bacillus sp. CGMCC 1.16607 TaxID=3351842 RepID=UPI00362C6A97